jgi:hypothetical protein
MCPAIIDGRTNDRPANEQQRSPTSHLNLIEKISVLEAPCLM